MFVLLNGAFGVGKTTVAAILASELPDTSIYDPEQVGFVLHRIPPWLLGRARRPDDFQDLALWRSLIVRGARHAKRRATTVIVPMAFSDLGYFHAFGAALGADASVRKFCLLAPLDVIHDRLRRRARTEHSTDIAWALRRSAECCKAHASAAFGEPVDATRTPPEIAGRIKEMIAA